MYSQRGDGAEWVTSSRRNVRGSQMVRGLKERQKSLLGAHKGFGSEDTDHCSVPITQHGTQLTEDNK